MGSEKNRQIVANYDEVARVSPLDIVSSGRYASSLFGYSRRLGRFLADKMELGPKDRVLDAGCNVGIYHPELAARAGSVFGVDASSNAIARARARHSGLKNVEYRAGDLTTMKSPDFPHRFDKILCYSVVHFLGSIEEFESLLKTFVSLLEGGHGIVFLGEVRETELYERFLEESRQGKSSTFRDLKFSLLKKIQRWLLRGGRFKEGIPPTLFRRRDIEEMAHRLGARCERIEQESWHPFYNTCVDYLFRF